MCDLCPKVYHAACVKNPDVAKGHWKCSWHSCADCGRTKHKAGSMLIHCFTCPTALCPDCFPPEFRRVHPHSSYWTALTRNGWKVAPQSMLTFQCNSCRAALESKRLADMKAEELELEEAGRRREALEERERLRTIKQKQEDAEITAQMNRLLHDHERETLWQGLQVARDKLQKVAAAYCPPQLNVAAAAKRIAAAAARRPQDEQALALDICSNCWLPGHAVRACPFPKERVYEPIRGPNCAKSSYTHRALCGLCSRVGHRRAQCSNLTQEMKLDYESRMRASDTLTSSICSAQRPPATPSDADPTTAARRIAAHLGELVRGVLTSSGLSHCSVAPQAHEPPQKRRKRPPSGDGTVGGRKQGRRKLVPRTLKFARCSKKTLASAKKSAKGATRPCRAPAGRKRAALARAPLLKPRLVVDDVDLVDAVCGAERTPTKVLAPVAGSWSPQRRCLDTPGGSSGGLSSSVRRRITGKRQVACSPASGTSPDDACTRLVRQRATSKRQAG